MTPPAALPKVAPRLEFPRNLPILAPTIFPTCCKRGLLRLERPLALFLFDRLLKLVFFWLFFLYIDSKLYSAGQTLFIGIQCNCRTVQSRWGQTRF